MPLSVGRLERRLHPSPAWDGLAEQRAVYSLHRTSLNRLLGRPGLPHSCCFSHHIPYSAAAVIGYMELGTAASILITPFIPASLRDWNRCRRVQIRTPERALHDNRHLGTFLRSQVPYLHFLDSESIIRLFDICVSTSCRITRRACSVKQIFVRLDALFLRLSCHFGLFVFCFTKAAGAH